MYRESCKKTFAAIFYLLFLYLLQLLYEFSITFSMPENICIQQAQNISTIFVQRRICVYWE